MVASAAGSLVAWSLQITNIDPLKYNLLFERFLNPERISMPDIDIDFCIEGRDAVINYVREKYGHDKVGQIITFGTMMAKGVIKDVARVLGMPFEDSNAISALIPEQLKITLKEAIEQEPKLKELIENNVQVAKVFEIAFKLEGVTRHASKHAAGIVISPEPIDEVLPVYVPPKSNELVTQYAMTELEALGFLKIDLLGLKNLTLIERALQLIKKNHEVSINLDKLPCLRSIKSSTIPDPRGPGR
jgi:DNA polymerase III subunit alpha